MVTVQGSLVVLAVGLLVGGLAVYLGALFALKARSYGYAVVTAGMGAVAWWLLEIGLAEFGVTSGSLASVLGLVVWVAVLRWRYDTGWIRAALIGAFAWIAALVVLATLSDLGVAGIEAYGVPV